jgi:hypothetical protein
MKKQNTQSIVPGGWRRVVLSVIVPALVVGLTLSAAAFADDYSATIQEFKKTPAVRPFFDNAYGYAVFPVVGKGGLGLGAAFGKGGVYAGGRLTGTATLLELSVGWQAGGQAISEIIFFKDKRAYDDFTSGRFEFDAEASAVAITAGAQAAAGTMGATAGAGAGGGPGKQLGTEYRKGMAVFVFSKGGLMYQAAIGGQKFGFTPVKGK